MSMNQKKVVMYESTEAASIQTVTGWVDANGRFFGDDEALARYCGSTHRQCKKNPGHPVHETNGWCATCHEEAQLSRFAAMPRRVWAGEPIADYEGDVYFFDNESLLDHIIEHGISPADFKLVFCTPNMPSEIEPADYFCDDLPPDGEISDNQLLAAFGLVNEMIRKSDPLSWSPSAEAVELPASFLALVAEARKAA